MSCRWRRGPSNISSHNSLKLRYSVARSLESQLIDGLANGAVDMNILQLLTGMGTRGGPELLPRAALTVTVSVVVVAAVVLGAVSIINSHTSH